MCAQLSQDILLDIFWLCSEFDWSGEQPLPLQDVSSWDWIIITHINKYWRSTALSSPLLWCKPSLIRHSSARLAAFLERSQKAPLTITTPPLCGPADYWSRSDHKCRKCRDNLLTSLRHLRRIRHLDINFYDYELFERMEIKIDALVLEELILTYEPYATSFPATDPSPLAIPPCFLTLRAPTLKKLRLRGIHMRYDSAILKSLECFDLDNFPFSKPMHYAQVSEQERWAPSFQELIGMLNASPKLKTVRLFMIRSSFDADGDDHKYRYNVFHRAEPVQLESLELGHIDTPTYKRLLNTPGLKFQDSTPFKTDEVLYRDVSEYPIIARILDHVFQQKPCDTLRLSFTGNWSIVHADLRDTLDFGSGFRFNAQTVNKRLPSSISLGLIQCNNIGNCMDQRHINHSATAQMILNIIKDSYLSHTRTQVLKLHLKVSYLYCLDEREWRRHFDSDPFKSVDFLRITVEELETLVASNAQAHTESGSDTLNVVASINVNKTLLDALSPLSETENIYGEDSTSPHPPENQNAAPVVLPRLTKLTICVSSLEDVFDTLLNCVKTRHECGVPIHELRISELGEDRVEQICDDSTRTNMDVEIKRYVKQLEYAGESFGLLDN